MEFAAAQQIPWVAQPHDIRHMKFHSPILQNSVLKQTNKKIT